MLGDFIDACSKIIESFFGTKHKPCISDLLYVFSGIMVGLCIVTLIVPFRYSTEFLDSIVWGMNLNDESIVVKLVFRVSIIYVVYCLVKEVLVYAYREAPAKKLKRVYTNLYTGNDVLDLVTATCSSIFAVTVFLQMYKTGILYISVKAMSIYVWIIVRALTFVVRRYAYHNAKIIESVIKNYPDLM